MMEKMGKVWLLGAGPGDAGLCTVKGKQILSEAEVVVYDALVGDGILGWIPETAKQIYVGKRGGFHAKSQDEINEILIEEGKTGKRIVRLKGGDPFVFGRGSEEALALHEHHIPFEVIPGVTSAVAVPAYCGIPVTHRGIATSFHVITGHLKDSEPVNMDYEALVRVGGTLIFLMGLSSAEAICNGLMNAGMNQDTPAALLQEGTTANQQKVISTLKHLAVDGKKAGIRTPAIIVIGEVCALEGICRWAEEKPLFGKKILVTRPRKRAERMAEKLREAGAEVVELPTIETHLIPENEPLESAIKNIAAFDWLAFTSPGGVELFFEYLKEHNTDVRILSDLKIAVIGRGTSDMLKGYGIYADYMPERFYAADLGVGLAEQMKSNERLLILRAEKGSEELLIPLDKAQIRYEDVALYRTTYPTESPQTLRIKHLLEEKQFDFVTFTSGSTVTGFMNILHPSVEELRGFTAVCIGEQTAACVNRQGMTTIVSSIPSMDSMVEAIGKHSVLF
ncbi:MAG: uroporphyrinogen-III C-methyltransferase [Clostridium sp.]